MGIETATYLNQLEPANPAGSDPLQDADNHLRLIKQVLKNTFPNVDGPVQAHHLDFLGLCPRYSVIMWFGEPADIPPGWALCNGQTVYRAGEPTTFQTPDLRDRFVLGAGATFTKGTNYGASGVRVTTSTVGDHTHGAGADAQGNHNHNGTQGRVLEVGHLPSHNHGFSGVSIVAGQGNGLYFPSGNTVFSEGKATDMTGGNVPHNHGIDYDGSHSHNIQVYGGGTHAHTVDVPMTPLSTALYFIIKT